MTHEISCLFNSTTGRVAARCACRRLLELRTAAADTSRDRSLSAGRPRRDRRASRYRGQNRRTTRTRTDAGSVIGQVTQLVSANETLKRENAELLAVNEQLRAHLAEIGSALGSC